MNIAICDDEPREIAVLSAMLAAYMEKTGATLLLSEFCSGEELLCAFEKGARFDVIFLDVLMPGINGIDAARELRLLDAAAELVFLTNTPDFALDAFGVKARDYLVKPLSEATLFRSMDEINARLDDENVIVIQSKKGLRRLKCDRVEYCEVLGHTVLWHLRSGMVLESGGGIQKAEALLAGSGCFLRVHRSFLVNFNCISSFDRPSCSLQLESMIRIPVSRVKFTEIRQAYMNHVKEETEV